MDSRPRDMDLVIKTEPLNWQVNRRLKDLKVLRQRLSVMHPDTLIPPIPADIPYKSKSFKPKQ